MKSLLMLNISLISLQHLELIMLLQEMISQHSLKQIKDTSFLRILRYQQVIKSLVQMSILTMQKLVV